MEEIHRRKIIHKVFDGRLPKNMATLHMGISDCQLRRLLSRYRESGLSGMVKKSSNSQYA
ncbi:TPA: helix-turn-helix domain-containing protein [Klebsiella quasipneumoniae subsp. quasipneumoniae]|nr:helix-turn-helix domain-containing protein [Klebsiella quasipneumoniae subsp. quasipneumoniae]